MVLNDFLNGEDSRNLRTLKEYENQLWLRTPFQVMLKCFFLIGIDTTPFRP